MTRQHLNPVPVTPKAPLDAGRELDVRLAVYSELKAEQRSRFPTRDNLVYATLAGITVLAGAALGAMGGVLKPTPAMWLVVPPVIVVLGWTRVQNDLKISAIGWHVRTKVELPVNALFGKTVMGWESTHNGPGTGRTLRKACQLVADLILYGAAPAAALIASWTTGHLAWYWVMVSIAEAVTVAGLIYMIVVPAYFSPQRPAHEQEKTW